MAEHDDARNWLKSVRVEGPTVFWKDKMGNSRHISLEQLKSYSETDSWSKLYEAAMKIVNKTDGESVRLSSMKMGEWFRDGDSYYMVGYCELPLTNTLIISSGGKVSLRSGGDMVQKIEVELHIEG